MASVVLHVGYNFFLVQAYHSGDFGQVYPIARGTAPLIVTLVMTLFLDEAPSAGALGGIALLVAGVWLMSVRGGRLSLPSGYRLTTSGKTGSFTPSGRLRPRTAAIRRSSRACRAGPERGAVGPSR